MINDRRKKRKLISMPRRSGKSSGNIKKIRPKPYNHKGSSTKLKKIQ